MYSEASVELTNQGNESERRIGMSLSGLGGDADGQVQWRIELNT